LTRHTTADSDDGHNNYWGRLTQAPLLTPEEEVSLTLAAQRGDEQARERLIESNMRLVINIARSYRSQAVPLEDLIQEGAIGLMHAVARFDPTKGFRFSIYATHWIRQSIGRALDGKSKAIRLPAHISQSIRRIERERLRLTRELGHEPTHDQLAKAIGLSPRKLTHLMVASQDLLSLDMRIGDTEQTTLGAMIHDTNCENPEDEVLFAERTVELQDILKELNEREQRVMSQRLRLEDNEEVTILRDKLADEMRVSRERIRQIELSAIKKLRILAHQRKLRDYLGR